MCGYRCIDCMCKFWFLWHVESSSSVQRCYDSKICKEKKLWYSVHYKIFLFTLTYAHTPSHMHAHTHTHPHTLTHAHTRTHPSTHPHTCPYTHTPIHTLTHAHTHTHPSTPSHMPTHTHTHPHTLTHAHTLTHTHTHTLIHTPSHMPIHSQQWRRQMVMRIPHLPRSGGSSGRGARTSNRPSLGGSEESWYVHVEQPLQYPSLYTWFSCNCPCIAGWLTLRIMNGRLEELFDANSPYTSSIKQTSSESDQTTSLCMSRTRVLTLGHHSKLVRRYASPHW